MYYVIKQGPTLMYFVHVFSNGGYLTLEGDSSYSHSLSFKCEGLQNILDLFLL